MLTVSALAPADWDKLTSLPTADLCDEYGDKILYFPAFPFRSFGKRRRFHGFAQTVDCRHGDDSGQPLLDNTYVKSLANEKQTRDAVLFVHGGGLLAPNAVVGDQIAEKARENGFTGFVVFGNVRDCAEIDQMDLGVKALSTHPRKTMKANKGVRGKEIRFELTTSSASAARSGAESSVTVRPGDFVVADEDGIVMVPKEDGRARGRNSYGAAGGAGEESEQKRAKL